MTDLILLSGGLDSATLLARQAHAGTASAALGVRYGQRHAVELDHAAHLAAHYRVPFDTVDLTSWGRMLAGSALTDPDTPLPGPDADAAPTVVPNRNMLLIAAAAAVAQARGLTSVWFAAHAGDRDVYPDCRPEFVAAADQTVQLATGGTVRVVAPFLNLAKVEIAVLAGQLGVPTTSTWSCYAGGQRHCGACSACVARRRALHDAGFGDPTIYSLKGVA